jgi:hypothetical protein
MSNDFFSTLRVYLAKLSEGEHSPSEVVASLNTWLRDSGESIKLKIEEEVERSVKKMGFVKQAEFAKLKKEVEELKISVAGPSMSVKPKAVKKVARKVVKKVVKKSGNAEKPVKKATAAKGKK